MSCSERESQTGDVLDLGVQNEIVSKTGAWFSYKDQRLGHSREKAKEFLAQNPEVLSIKKEVKSKFGLDEAKGCTTDRGARS